MIARIKTPTRIAPLAACATALWLLACDPSQASEVQQQAIGAPQSCYLSGISDRARCGFVEVPENAAKPDGRKIQVHYAVLPAIKPSFPNEAFLAIAGGPGQSAIDNAVGFERTFAEIRQSRDILLIDQRGTGRSNLLNCDLGPDAMSLAFDDEKLDSAAEAVKCRSNLDADIAQYGSRAALEDFEAVRKALGYDKLHVYGISYGTRMAQLYLKHYPESLLTVTLDGVVPMQQSVLAIGDAIDRAVELMLADCEQNSQCHTQFPVLRDELAMVNQRLDQAPVRLMVNHPRSGEATEFLLTRNKFASVVRLALYATNVRALLPLAIHQAAAGNYQGILGLHGMMLDGLDLAMGMHSSVVCGEDIPRLDAAMRAKLNQSYYGANMIKGLEEVCTQWPVPAADATFAEGVRSNLPVLLLSGEIDPATPPEWAELAMANMSNAKHLVAPYATHGVAQQSCGNKLVAQLVNSGSLKEIQGDCLNKDVRRSFYLNASTVEPLPATINKE
ncbi:alpha/beta fold hydrolase [Shewanella cyperi]|uniref:Alpha/beta fold hydrolase n=1 Tax=Shewanella cyperi TaxID=2814292 RepID=A0A975AKS7_9GAMM|nr:alpha/beta hydrolase [Shewanella cyperi]QSX30046.1 alpha/beta fold hydrolase [Shewanella cyperi]